MRDFTLDELQKLIKMAETTTATGDPFIDQRHRSHIEQFNTPMPYYLLFYFLAAVLKPGIVVELGAWQGTAAAHFASGNKTTKVITIDHHSDPGDEINRRLTQEAAIRYPNLIYFQGWTINEVAQEQRGKHKLGDSASAYEQVTQFLNGRKIDILFIDSWHQYEYAIRDWRAYEPLLASPSLVVCDDLLGGDGPAIGGMQKFWKELPGEKFLNDTMHPGFPMGFIKHEKTNTNTD